VKNYVNIAIYLLLLMEQFDNRNSSFASIEDKSKNAGKMKIKNKENKPPKIFQLKYFFLQLL